MEAKTNTIHVKVDPETKRAIRLKVIETGETITEFVQRAVRELLK